MGLWCYATIVSLATTWGAVCDILLDDLPVTQGEQPFGHLGHVAVGLAAFALCRLGISQVLAYLWAEDRWGLQSGWLLALKL